MRADEAKKDMRIQKPDRTIASLPPGKIVEVLNDQEVRVQWDGDKDIIRELLVRLHKV